MKMGEIRRRYHGEWVLIEYTKLDEELNVVEGDVIAHASTKEEIYKKLLEIKGQQIAIEYLGELPEDIAVMI